MDIRGSFSRLKKKLKHSEIKHKPDRTEANSREEREDPPTSPSPPVLHVVVGGGHRRGEDGVNTDGGQISSTDRPLLPDVPGPALAGRIKDTERGGDGGVDGVEVSQRPSHPHSDIKVVVGSRLGWGRNESCGENVGRVHPSPSTPLILLSGKSGTGTWFVVLVAASDRSFR